MTRNLNNPGNEEQPRARRKLWRIVGALTAIAVLVVVGMLVYVNSDGFSRRMRARAIDSIENATGGKTQLGDLQWSLSHRTVVLNDLTIRGREDPSDVPFLHVDRITAKIKIISLFSRDFSLEDVVVEHPTAHLIVYPDGTTNQPRPTEQAPALHGPVKQMFSLALEHARAANGLVIFNERRIPFELRADQVTARVSYDTREKRYDGTFSTANIAVSSPEFKSFSGGGEATFSLYPDHALIESLTAHSGRSRLAAVGNVTRFNPPVADFKYQADVDLAEFAAIVHFPQLRSGRSAFTGSARFADNLSQIDGKVVLRDAAYEDANVRLRGVNGGAEYSYLAAKSRLQVPHIFLHGLGGSASGSALIENWLHAPNDPAKPGTRNEGERGSVELALTALSAHDLAIATASRMLPLDQLHAVGRISGKAGVKWTYSARSARVDLDLVATPPANAAPGELPVAGFLQGTYSASSELLAIASSSLTTPASHVVASGDIGARTADLRLTATTSNLGEVAPLIAAIRGPEPLPFNLGGNASFRGTLSGKLRAPTIAGHLDAADFATQLARRLEAPLPPAPAPDSRFVRWDSLAADFIYAPDKLTVSQAQLRRKNALVSVNGSSSLTDGVLTAASQFQAHVLIRGADLAELQSVLGFDYPLTGRVDLTMDVGGTRDNLNGGGRLALTRGSAYGQTIKSLSAAINFSDDQVQLRDTVVVGDLGTVNGSAAYNLNAKSFRLDLRGTDFRVERFAFANRPNIQASGQITFEASGSGTLEAPVINASLRLRNLTVNRQAIGGFDLDAVTRGAELQVTTHSSMQHAAVVLDGSIHLRGDMPGHAVLVVNSANLNPLIAAFVPIRISGPTVLDSRIEVNGPFRDPRNLAVSVKVDRLSSELEGIGVYNAGPISLRIANQVLTIDRFRLAGEGTRFLQIRGSAELSGEQKLDFQAEGDLNLKLLQSANSSLISSGYSDFSVAVKGALHKPLINGQLNFHDGAVAFLDLPNGLSEINGTVYFNQDRAQIQKLVARTGGGMLDLGGFVSYDRGIAFNVTATGREIRIRYPAGVSSTATAALELSGNLKNSVLSGDVTVTRFGLNPQFDFAYYLARSKEPPGAPNTASPLNNVRLDVHVVSTQDLQVQTSLAKVSGNVDLHLRGTATHPVLLGHINIVEGTVDFNGTTYTLERGDISFANPITIDPILDIAASAHVRDYDITLGFHGSPLQNKLATTYRSDPPLQPGDIIALLALGRTREEAMNVATAPGSQQQTFSDTTSNALLGEAINATISNRVQKIFGVSRIKIDPQVAGVENSGYARLTVDQQISNKVTLTYITNLSQSAQQIIQFEYNINSNVSVIAVRDQNGIVSFDVRLRQRKR